MGWRCLHQQPQHQRQQPGPCNHHHCYTYTTKPHLLHRPCSPNHPSWFLGSHAPLLPRGGEGESSARSPPFPRGYLWFFGLSAGSLRCIGYLCCPSRACVRLSVCAHLFWRNHPPTTLIFNKDPPPSSSQHDRRRRQSRQHSFSSSPGRAVCWRRRRRRRKKEGGEEEEKKYTVCTQCLLLHDVQYLSI